MSDLITWLRAQLDEDERVARETARPLACGCHPGADTSRWSFDFDDRVRTGIHDVVTTTAWSDSIDPPVGAHIATWDPARVLAEVDAKRRILDEVDEHWDDANPIGGRGSMFLPRAWETVLRLLALPYVDRPGYREEWRP